MKHGKRFVESAKLVDRSKLYDTTEALGLVCETAKAKFDETVELHIRLGVDGRARCGDRAPRPIDRLGMPVGECGQGREHQRQQDGKGHERRKGFVCCS